MEKPGEPKRQTLEELLLSDEARKGKRPTLETPVRDREKAIQAAVNIMAMSKGVTLGKDITIRELIDEGRP